MRGIREENIQGLRKRIATLFFQYIKTPQFNPAAAKHIKVPQDLLESKIESFFCKTCERYLPSIEFQVSSLLILAFLALTNRYKVIVKSKTERILKNLKLSQTIYQLDIIISTLNLVVLCNLVVFH